jgi:anti-sigma factor RsiW
MNMNELINLSGTKLKRMAVLKAQIERLQSRLETLAGNTPPSPGRKAVRKRRKMSAAARRKISLAAKARWAKVRAAKKSK